MHTHYSCKYTWRSFFYPIPSLPLLPLPFLFYSPLYPFSTYLAPSSCDRNRPPPSQVACKLTLFAPPFTQLSHPFQLPRTPTAQRLTTTTLGLFRSCYAEQLLHCILLLVQHASPLIGVSFTTRQGLYIGPKTNRISLPF